MCQLCEKTTNLANYQQIFEKTFEEDLQILENTKGKIDEMKGISNNFLTTINFPFKVKVPLFEPRVGFCAPNNYFQNIFLNGEKLGNSFTNKSTRSVFFNSGRMILISKSLNIGGVGEFYTSYLAVNFEKGEYELEVGEKQLKLSAKKRSKAKNLLNGEIKEFEIAFSFSQENLDGKFIQKSQVANSTLFSGVYGQKSNGPVNAAKKVASMDLEGYVITVPHFAPHPYLLKVKNELGIASNRAFQEQVINYFKEHK
jgi:hypothetical protein